MCESDAVTHAPVLTQSHLQTSATLWMALHLRRSTIDWSLSRLRMVLLLGVIEEFIYVESEEQRSPK